MSRFNGIFCCALPILNLYMAPKLWLDSRRAGEFDIGLLTLVLAVAAVLLNPRPERRGTDPRRQRVTTEQRTRTFVRIAPD